MAGEYLYQKFTRNIGVDLSATGRPGFPGHPLYFFTTMEAF